MMKLIIILFVAIIMMCSCGSRNGNNVQGAGYTGEFRIEHILVDTFG